jgi:hypothetical protein
LSPGHREVIDLVYYHEKSIDEVAEITGVPENTVKTRMFYARKRIAELMGSQGIDRSHCLIHTLNWQSWLAHGSVRGKPVLRDCSSKELSRCARAASGQ